MLINLFLQETFAMPPRPQRSERLGRGVPATHDLLGIRPEAAATGSALTADVTTQYLQSVVDHPRPIG